MFPRKAVVKSPTVPLRHQESGARLDALNLRTKPLIAVPTGVARSENNLDSMVIPGAVRGDGVIVDENRREYVKVAKVAQTQNSEIHLVQIIDSVQTQVFVGKQVAHPAPDLPQPSRGLSMRRALRPKNIVPPGPFHNPDLENEVRQTLSDMSLDGDVSHPSPFATHAVVVTDHFSLVLLPVGHADAFNVMQSLYEARQAARTSDDPDAIAEVTLRAQHITRKMLHEVLGELSGCHAKSRVHRDIKNENIFVTVNGVFSIGDQGLTAPANCFDHKLGTHQAPEGHLDHFVDPKKLDVWALSVAAMQMLSDEILFPPSTQALYQPHTLEGRATLRADMEAYTRVWARFGGQLTADDLAAIKALYREPQGMKKPEARSLHRSAGSRTSLVRPTTKRRGSSRSIATAIPSRGSTSSLSSLALTRVRSAPMEEAEDEWTDDSMFSPALVREKFDEMQRTEPMLVSELNQLMRTDLPAKVVAEYRASVAETLHALQSDDPTLFPVLFRMAQLVPENEARLLTPVSMTESFQQTLDSGYDLGLLWRQMAHALSFSEAGLVAKFESLRDAASDELFDLIVQGLHPLPAARPSAQDMYELCLQPPLELDAEAAKDIRLKLGEVEGAAWKEFEAFRKSYKEAPRPSLHQRLSQAEKRHRRHSVASPTTDKPEPWVLSPLKRESSLSSADSSEPSQNIEPSQNSEP